MDVVSQNIANINTTKGPHGKPYVRQQAVFETVLQDQMNPGGLPGSGPQIVRLARIESSNRAPRTVYQPGHADADGNGMVSLPNINLYEEMVDLMSASRAYEANLDVVKTARTMAQQTLAIGKR
jgi:flagellar basal-body rod protein FlgC